MVVWLTRLALLKKVYDWYKRNQRLKNEAKRNNLRA